MKLFRAVSFIRISVYLYLAIFLFLFCYTFYRAEFIHSGNQFSYYNKYYSIFIFGTLFWFVVLFLNEKRKLQIVILSTSLIFILYFYETISFFAPSILKLNFIKSIYKETTIKSQIDTKSKYDVIQELKINRGIDVVPSVFPKAFIKKKWTNEEIDVFPLGGVSNTITVFCKEGEEFSIYKSDRYGFNNPDKVWNNKKVFWFLVGDSFTQGSCVQQNENFASQIRSLTKQSAISVGISGNGPLIELASLKEYGSKKRPRIVLWFYFERNDLEDLKNEKSSSILMKYLNENFSQNLYSKQIEVDKKLKTYILIAEKGLDKKKLEKKENLEKFLPLKKIIRLQIIRDKTSLDRGLDYDIDPLFEKIMLKARNLVNEWDGKLYFVYLPDKERYSSKTTKDDRYLKRLQVIKLINNLNIPMIDIHEEFFMKQIDPLSFYAHRIYGHYNPEGYHKISELIVKKINNIN